MRKLPRTTIFPFLTPSPLGEGWGEVGKCPTGEGLEATKPRLTPFENFQKKYSEKYF